jgi:hypothetical protein
MVSHEYGEALAEALAAAREIYVQDFAFNMPETVTLTITCDPKSSVELYTNGQDSMFMSLSSPKQLAAPTKSGIFHLYGICHELGHIAMYRLLTNREWMSGDAAEGWAHYAGSVVLDRVYERKGPNFWPDPYDYRQDGTARLQNDLMSKSPSGTALAAAQWLKLDSIIGHAGFAQLFSVWQSTPFDFVNPSNDLLTALSGFSPEKKMTLKEWWGSAAPLFLQPVQVSLFKTREAAPSNLTGKPVTISLDDGIMDDMKSIAGGGYGRRFSTPSEGDWYITAVWLHGERYGDEAPPSINFDIALCDADAKLIKIWKKPYSLFESGAMKWVRLEVPPTLVPKTFYACFNFNPTASNGVYVAYDTSTTGNSIKSRPGSPPIKLEKSDWMIRIELQAAK